MERKQFTEEYKQEALRLVVSQWISIAWSQQVPPVRKLSDQAIYPKIAEIHQASGRTYASPRVYHKLKKDGVVCSRKRVERNMRGNNIVSLHHKPKFNPQTTDSTYNMPIAENVIRQNFNAKRTNEKKDIRDYIESFYNCTRMHSSRDYLAPLECELSA